jgi:hypothetical protein
MTAHAHQAALHGIITAAFDDPNNSQSSGDGSTHHKPPRTDVSSRKSGLSPVKSRLNRFHTASPAR